MSLVLLFLPQETQGGVESANASVAAESAAAFSGASISAGSVTSIAESVVAVAGESIASGAINGEAASEVAFLAESPAVIASGDFAFGGSGALFFKGECLGTAAEEVSRPAWWYRRRERLREEAAPKRSARPKSRTVLSRYN